jgi:hypothetical protein
LKNKNGVLISTQAELETLATDFYTRLFSAKSKKTKKPTMVTQYEKLCGPVTDQEIKNALFMMHPNKLP